MLRTQGQQWEIVKEDGWAELPNELLAKVLELQAGQEGGLRFSKTSATVRLVCAAWKAVYDALVTRLVLTRETTDDAMGMLVRRFPAVVSLKMKYAYGAAAALTDEAMRAVSSLRALTTLHLTDCEKVSDEGLRAVSSCTGLTSLYLANSGKVTDEGVKAVSSLPALKSLDLRFCFKVTDEGVRAVSSCIGLTSLHLYGCVMVTDEALRAVSNLPALNTLDLRYNRVKVTDVGVKALSILPALTTLDLRGCSKVTAAGVQALRSTTAAPSLRIVR
jgi:hypothetical protein